MRSTLLRDDHLHEGDCPVPLRKVVDLQLAMIVVEREQRSSNEDRQYCIIG
jgi:hypothetical protein